ncbi:TolC family outer membrane protein [Roseitranquillus sediminis]|uniref:TolC family outer membrane protein n=1 Tax=Roseitranquillus sediminis TaxID=2809051 RepID=UPI001D0CA760|nr:TolC family outer membrane protein [Roseitranquillus sediminis]MBM9595804.1 TolC family outer membrane protein [Roseitranquillus sediminis]
MRVKRVGRTVMAAAIAWTLAGQAQAQSLTDAFISAYRESGLLEQNRALVRAADEDVAQAVAALRPVLNYLASTTYTSPVGLGQDNLSFGLGLSADLLIYDNGATDYAVSAAKEAVLAAREALRGVEQDVLLRAARAYFNVRRSAEFVDLAEGSVRVITQELRAARDRFEVGEVTRTDVAIAEARLAASRSTLAAAVGDLAQAREEYRAVVGDYPGQLASPPATPSIPDTLDAAIAIARDRHPAIKEAQRETQVAELNVLRAEASLGPTLSANADLNFDEDWDNRRSVGLTFSGPIYQGGRLTSLVRQARARRDASRAALYSVVRQVEQAVGNAWAVLNVTGASIQAGQQQSQAADVALQGVQEELRLGARTTLDVLNAEQELLDARANLVSAQIDQQIAVYALWQAMGMLTVDGLNLGIATYDPAAYYKAVESAPVRNVSPRGEKLDHVLKSLLR